MNLFVSFKYLPFL